MSIAWLKAAVLNQQRLTDVWHERTRTAEAERDALRAVVQAVRAFCEAISNPAGKANEAFIAGRVLALLPKETENRMKGGDLGLP